MQTLNLYLEDIAGDWYGWIEMFPGAFSQGTTIQEATGKAPVAFVEYLHWLREHGELPPARLNDLTSATIRIEVIQTHSPHVTDLGDEVHGFFKPDERPVDEEDLTRYLRLLGHARNDLRTALRALPPDQWNAAPFGGKSVSWILRHLATIDQFHLERLHIETIPLEQAEPLARVEAARDEFERGIWAFPAHKRGEIFTVDGEKWSLRKVLRRALWHERYHAAQVAARSNPMEFLRSAVVHSAFWNEEARFKV